MAGLIGIVTSYQKDTMRKRNTLQSCVDNGLLTTEGLHANIEACEEAFLKKFREKMKLTCKLMVIVKEERKLAGLDNEESSSDNPVLTDKYWYLLTVRPPHDICFGTFSNRIELFVNRTMISSAEYSYEQTGESLDELGKGFHCHLVLHSPYAPSKLLEIINKDFVGWHSVVGKDSQKYLKCKRDLEFARNYIRGEKHNDSKKPAVLMNTAWREKLKLKTLYDIPRREG